jgi:type IX secretion system PorP/SprF family membrane protein
MRSEAHIGTGILTGLRWITLVMLFIGGFWLEVFSQSVPARPFSIPVYQPMVLNPAFVGSKDFTNISLTSKAFASPTNQVISVHQRLKSTDIEFSHFGIGGYAYHEQLPTSWNMGLSAAVSYHIPLDAEQLHNLSIGASAKGMLFTPKKNTEAPYDSASAAFRPDMDVGIFYYGPQAFAGISSTSILESGERSDSMDAFAWYDREYHLYGGYKFILNKDLGIVLEPSLLLTVNDSTLSEAHKHLVPYIKVYLQNFYVGTYLKDLDIFALFFKYQFPKFSVGAFLEFPRIGFLDDDNITFELSVGLHLGTGGSSFLQYRHW